MSVPNWYELVLLGIAAFRTWVLLAQDTILDRPRAYVVKRGGEWTETLLECPWCAGTYISLAWWGAWQLWEHGTLVAAAAVTIMTFVPALDRALSDD